MTATARRGSSRKSTLGLLLALPPVVVVAVFVGFPIVTAVAFTLGFTGGLNSVVSAIGLDVHRRDHWWGTLAAYRDVMTDAGFQRDLVATVLITAVSTAVVLALALGIGLYLRLNGGFLARMLSALAVVPLFIPVVIASWAILTFYSGDGFVRSVFASVGLVGPTWGYTLVAVVIGSVWTALPFAVLMIASGLQAVPEAVIEAARDAGATTTTLVRTVLVPMAFVPTVIAASFTGISIIGSFTVPYFTGPNAPNMLGVTLTDYFVSYNRPQQSVVMAIAVFAIAAIIGALYVWANVRSAREQGRV